MLKFIYIPRAQGSEGAFMKDVSAELLDVLVEFISSA